LISRETALGPSYCLYGNLVQHREDALVRSLLLDVVDYLVLAR
jgi:hypothetical protein